MKEVYDELDMAMENAAAQMREGGISGAAYGFNSTESDNVVVFIVDTVSTAAEGLKQFRVCHRIFTNSLTDKKALIDTAYMFIGIDPLQAGLAEALIEASLDHLATS